MAELDGEISRMISSSAVLQVQFILFALRAVFWEAEEE